MFTKNLRSFQTIFLLLVFILSAESSPVLNKRSSQCSARDIAIVRRTILDETYFCKWWLSDGRTRSPFLEFTPDQVDKLCRCIVTTSSKPKREVPNESGLEKRQTKASCSAEVSVQFTQPWHFCTFYNAYPRTSSPFAKYSAKQLLALCNCATGQATSSTKKSSSSIRKTTSSSSSSKTSSVRKSSSTTRASSTPKPSSTTKLSSTKVSSSTKTSSSSQKKSSSSILIKDIVIEKELIQFCHHRCQIFIEDIVIEGVVLADIVLAVIVLAVIVLAGYLIKGIVIKGIVIAGFLNDGSTTHNLVSKTSSSSIVISTSIKSLIEPSIKTSFSITIASSSIYSTPRSSSTLSKTVISSVSSVSKSLSSSKIISSSTPSTIVSSSKIQSSSVLPVIPSISSPLESSSSLLTSQQTSATLTTSSAEASTTSSADFCSAQSMLLSNSPTQLAQASEYCSLLLRPVVTAVATTTEIVTTTLPTIRSTAIAVSNSSVAETTTSTYIETETLVVSVTAEITATQTSEIFDYVETTNIGTAITETVTDYQTSTALAARDVSPSSLPEPEAWSTLSSLQRLQACECILDEASLDPITTYRSTETRTQTSTVFTGLNATSTRINVVTSFAILNQTSTVRFNLSSTVSTAVSDYTITNRLNATYTTSSDTVVATTTRTVIVPAVALSHPTAIIGDLNGASRDVDDEVFPVTLPVALTLYGKSSADIKVSSNGLLGLGNLNWEYTNYALPYGDPSNFGDVVALGFWDDLYIYQGTQQGIYYQVSGSAPNRQTIFEFYISKYRDPTQYYHFLMEFAEDKPNFVTYQYLSVSDQGRSATVGIESTLTNNVTLTAQYQQFSFNQPVICPGMQLTFDTTPGKNSYNIDAPGSCTTAT
ncbi:hypothetical protein E4T48_00804 [Aureobasidium sp. EXF-10727]|nr:hypothetical protein E4T48_00804 [Aureobasidium sp. EXF-10727]KAI4732124.1 hypothetical protein E4T49_00013 [Aureobasidium sp. EXF-10728]